MRQVDERAIRYLVVRSSIEQNEARLCISAVVISPEISYHRGSVARILVHGIVFGCSLSQKM